MSINLLWIISLVCGTDFPKVCVLSTMQALFQLLLSNPSPIPLLKNWNRILCGSDTQTSKLGKCRESMATKLTSLSCLHTDPSLTEVPETALQRPGLWGHGGDGPGHQPDLPTQQRGVNSPPASPSLMPLPWNPSMCVWISDPVQVLAHYRRLSTPLESPCMKTRGQHHLEARNRCMPRLGVSASCPSRFSWLHVGLLGDRHPEAKGSGMAMKATLRCPL